MSCVQLEEERAEYEAAITSGPAIPAGNEPDLGMRVRLVHGDELISDSADGGLAAAVQVRLQSSLTFICDFFNKSTRSLLCS